MTVMNSQVHFSLSTDLLNKIRREAEKEEISVAEIIWRKLSDPPTKEEILRLRELEKLLVRK